MEKEKDSTRASRAAVRAKRGKKKGGRRSSSRERRRSQRLDKMLTYGREAEAVLPVAPPRAAQPRQPSSSSPDRVGTARSAAAAGGGTGQRGERRKKSKAGRGGAGQEEVPDLAEKVDDSVNPPSVSRLPLVGGEMAPLPPGDLGEGARSARWRRPQAGS